jgi:hypothetical protein
MCRACGVANALQLHPLVTDKSLLQVTPGVNNKLPLAVPQASTERDHLAVVATPLPARARRRQASWDHWLPRASDRPMPIPALLDPFAEDGVLGLEILHLFSEFALRAQFSSGTS